MSRPRILPCCIGNAAGCHCNCSDPVLANEIVRQLLTLASRADEVANRMQNVTSKERKLIRLHAKELHGAADIMREWAREIEKAI